MEKLIKEVLTNRASRNKGILAVLAAVVFNVGQPWG